MSLLSSARPPTILVVLLSAVVVGCSGETDTTERGDSGTHAKRRDLLADVIEAYREGQPEKGRELALRLVDRSLAGAEGRAVSDLKLGYLLGVSSTAETVTRFELDLITANSKPMDGPAREAVTTLLEKTERARKLASDVATSETLGERGQALLRQMNELHAKAIKNWILMNPRDERERIYRIYQKLLESQGIEVAGLLEATPTVRHIAADDLLLQSAKANTEEIREAIDVFYRALPNGDTKSMRRVLSKKTTDEQISRLIAKSEEDKKDLAIDKVASVDLDKAVVEPIKASNGHVRLRVTKIKITIEKGGRTSVIDHTGTFEVIREDERWVLCLK